MKFQGLERERERESNYSNKRREARASATRRLVGGTARGASPARFRSPSMAVLCAKKLEREREERERERERVNFSKLIKGRKKFWKKFSVFLARRTVTTSFSSELRLILFRSGWVL